MSVSVSIPVARRAQAQLVGENDPQAPPVLKRDAFGE